MDCGVGGMIHEGLIEKDLIYMKNIKHANVKAIASDLDGTLIKDHSNSLPDSFFDEIRAIQAKGIPFVAASGRQYANMRKILAPIADEIDYISENGCIITHKGEVVHINSIDRELALSLIDELSKEENAELMISGTSTGFVISKNKEYVRLLREVIGIEVTEVDKAEDITEEITKISILWEEGIPKEPEKHYHDKYDDKLLVANGGNGWLDFNNLGAGKGPALKVIAKYYGLTTDDFIVFGDNENDITMLEEGGISYAVSSATPYVKSHAKYVCEDVMEVLKNMFL